MDFPRYPISELELRILRLDGLSMLESQFQDRSLCEHTLSCNHSVVDQRDVEITTLIDDLMTSQSIEGRRDFPDFEMLDVRIAVCGEKDHLECALPKESQRSTPCSEIRPSLTRKADWLQICDHFRANGARDAAQGLSNLFNLCLPE